MLSVPTHEPCSAVAGDTWQWTTTIADYPPSDGWQLTTVFRGPGTLDVVATARDDATFVSLADPSVTAPLAAGTYQWARVLTRIVAGVTTRVTERTGQMQVTVDLTQSAAGATLSHAETMLTAIRAVLQGRATDDVQSYEIQGRALVKIPITELKGLESVYAAQVWRERHPGSPFPVRRARFGVVGR